MPTRSTSRAPRHAITWPSAAAPTSGPGRHLARLTVEIALHALLTRLPGLRADGEVEWDLENLPSVNPKRVPVAWDLG